MPGERLPRMDYDTIAQAMNDLHHAVVPTDMFDILKEVGTVAALHRTYPNGSRPVFDWPSIMAELPVSPVTILSLFIHAVSLQRTVQEDDRQAKLCAKLWALLENRGLTEKLEQLVRESPESSTLSIPIWQLEVPEFSQLSAPYMWMALQCVVQHKAYSKGDEYACFQLIH